MEDQVPSKGEKMLLSSWGQPLYTQSFTTKPGCFLVIPFMLAWPQGKAMRLTAGWKGSNFYPGSLDQLLFLSIEWHQFVFLFPWVAINPTYTGKSKVNIPMVLTALLWRPPPTCCSSKFPAINKAFTSVTLVSVWKIPFNHKTRIVSTCLL